MAIKRRKLTALATVLVLMLLFTFVIGFASNGNSQEEEIKRIILEKYRNLPSMEFKFATEPAASFDGINIRPYSNISISQENLEAGLVVGIITYGEKNYLHLAAKLPEEMEADFGAGIIDLATEKAEYAAVAQLETREEEVADISFSIEDTDEGDLEFLIEGRKHVITTSIPRNL